MDQTIACGHYLRSMQIALNILAGLLVLIGLLGTVLPFLPGTPLILAGLLLAAWVDRFQHVGVWPLVAIGAIAVASLAFDLLATAWGMKRTGASRSALFGAGIGFLLGIFAGLPGIVLGPFLGAIAGEYYERRNLQQATQVGVGTWLGMLLATGLRLGAGLMMLGIFVLCWLTA